MGPAFKVIFEEEVITLDIPAEGFVLESGWSITPHTHPIVSELLLISLAMKNSVTQFCGRYICNVYVCMLGMAHMTG